MSSRFIFNPEQSENSGGVQKDKDLNKITDDTKSKEGEIQKSVDTGTDAWGRAADNMKPRSSTYGDETDAGVSS